VSSRPQGQFFEADQAGVERRIGDNHGLCEGEARRKIRDRARNRSHSKTLALDHVLFLQIRPPNHKTGARRHPCTVENGRLYRVAWRYVDVMNPGSGKSGERCAFREPKARGSELVHRTALQLSPGVDARSNPLPTRAAQLRTRNPGSLGVLDPERAGEKARR
jgi:hypothetical protein